MVHILGEQNGRIAAYSLGFWSRASLRHRTGEDGAEKEALCPVHPVTSPSACRGMSSGAGEVEAALGQTQAGEEEILSEGPWSRWGARGFDHSAGPCSFWKDVRSGWTSLRRQRIRHLPDPGAREPGLSSKQSLQPSEGAPGAQATPGPAPTAYGPSSRSARAVPSVLNLRGT